MLQAVLPPSEDDEYASASVMQTEARLLQRLKDSQRASRARRCTSFSIAFALVGGGLALAITFVSLGLHNADCPEYWAGINHEGEASCPFFFVHVRHTGLLALLVGVLWVVPVLLVRPTDVRVVRSIGVLLLLAFVAMVTPTLTLALTLALALTLTLNPSP